MYKADRQTWTAAAGSDDATPLPLTAASLSSRLLLHRPLRPADRDHVADTATPTPATTAAQLHRHQRPSRPMLRNLSDLGPRATRHSPTAPLWPPPVSVLLNPDDEQRESSSVERSPTSSSPSSSRHPSNVCKSTDDVDRQPSPLTRDNDDADDHNTADIKLLPLPAAGDDGDTRTNHVVAPQQFVDHVTSSTSTIGRTASPSDNSQTVIVL